MHLKDHYRILELEPSASLAEIKKAYRRLALVYHPDKNSQDPYAAAQFAAIKESYEVLSNPSRKARYLQLRWYNQAMGTKRTAVVITPVTILQQALELERYVSKLDVHRMDKQGLFDYISGLLSDEVIGELNKFEEPGIKKEIAWLVLRSSHVLSADHVIQLSARLKKLYTDPALVMAIDQHIQKLNRRHQWERYLPLVVLCITAFICFLIYLLSKN